MNRRILTILFCTSVLVSYAQIPNGYYSSATGTGYTLKSSLHDIIDDHNQQSYGDMWDFIYDYDLDTYYENDGSILDIYSENPSGTDPYNFTRGSDQCGNYSGESSCYNREHSFPKSWFNDGSPMYSDAHHLYPTDGYVNGQRGSFPFGEVGSASFTSQNGSKKGSARSGLGYSGTVFEPIDEFKGDLARTYFYMATRYEDVLSSWSSEMLDGSTDQVYETWALEMLMEWHENDPVSQKEIDRNNNIYYNHQGNRNPFVDHPEYVNAIWGDGIINDDPTIILSKSSLDFGNVAVGGSSPSQTYTITGSNLEGDVTASVSLPFQVSSDNNAWVNQVIIGQANAEEGSNNTVYVRFSPQEENGQTYNSNVVHTSSGATSTNLSVSGKEGSEPDHDDITDVRSGSNGEVFTIEGVVTSPEMNSGSGQFFIQDETGGVFVYYAENPGLVSRGDLVRITGERDVYNEQVELLPSELTVLGSGEIPLPVDITSSNLSLSSEYLGSLVRISGVTVSSGWPEGGTSSGTSVNASVGGTDFVIRIDENSYYDGTTTPSGEFILQGVLDVFNSDVQIFPFVNGDVQEEAGLEPLIELSTSSLIFGQVTLGESAIESFTLNGSDLSENVSISTSGDYSLSLDEVGDFDSSILLGISSGSVNETVFVKYEPGAIGSSGGSISISSSGESDVVSLSGEGIESTSPYLIFDDSSFSSDFGSVLVGEESDIRSYTVSGGNLEGSVQVEAPDGFLISLFPTSLFNTSAILGVSGGTLSSKTIYVKFTPGSLGGFTGAISHDSGSLVENLSVQGVGSEPELILDDSGFNADFGQVEVGGYSVNQSFLLSGIGLSEVISVQAPEHFEVSLSESSGFSTSISVSSSTFTSAPIYVRFSPKEGGLLSGDVICSSGTNSASVLVSGSGLQVLSSTQPVAIKLYPNPVDGVLKIEGLPVSSTVRIFDSLGRRMNVKKVDGGVDVSEFEKGQYYLTVAGSSTKVLRFLVR